MTEQRDTTGVLRDISLLYELSLSVGRSLDLHENCRKFLRTLMARKNLDYTSVWVRSALIEPDSGDSLRLAFATPAFRAADVELADDRVFESLLGDSPFASVAHGSPEFAALVAESGIDSGAFALYRLGEFGFLKLYSIGRNEPFPDIELSKLRHVIEQFAISVGGCLDHERVRSEEGRRRELEQQVLDTQKLESLGLLAGGIAHDFNNLLAVILGNSDLIRLSVPTDSKEYLNQLETAAFRASELCSQLLAYAGRGRSESRTFDLTEAVKEMLKLCSVTISKKARLHSNLRPDLPGLDGDPGQVGQVAMNLITNASEALGDGEGDLYVTTGKAEIGAPDLANFRLGDQIGPGPYIFLDVEDSGCGIEAEMLDRLFDPFFTTKFTGRGLGLSAVLGIVRSHGGAIRVSSRPNSGTSVRVLFPISKAESIEPAPAARSIPSDDIQATVLVVDDEEPVRRVLGGLLKHFGCQVHFAADGGEALQVFQARSNSFDLIVLDYTMPVFDGYEVLQRLRASGAKIPVILMSGFSDADPTAERGGSGPTAFLRKPFSGFELERAVRTCLLAKSPLP